MKFDPKGDLTGDVLKMLAPSSLSRPDAVQVLQAMRCIGCQRAPTPEEIDGMFGNFGHKLMAGDESRLRWRCVTCAPSVAKRS